MIYSNDPAHNDNYRAETNKGKMAGITFIQGKTKCISCKTSRTTATGMFKKRGFVCNQCLRVKNA